MFAAFTRKVARLRRGGQFLERMKIQRERLALGSKASDLNQRRYEDSKLSTGAKAMQFCLDETLGHPEVQETLQASLRRP